ncbi:MAG: ATPase domain-containing protein [Candidatus Altiarchaeota archaeon]
MKIERVKTGIPGLDELIEDGFPRGSTILVSGEPGTGKTIFGLQFLIEGAKNNERGLYVSFEQNLDDILLQCEKFGWDVRQYINNGTLKISSFDIKEFKFDDMVQEIKSSNISRVVVDSLSSIISHPIAWEDIDTYYMITNKLDRLVPSPKYNIVIATRIFVHKIIDELKKLPCTSILTSELVGGSHGGFSRDTISEFLVDGLIILRYMVVGGEYSRNLTIQKMRYTKHSENIHPIEIRKDVGLVVLKP